MSTCVILNPNAGSAAASHALQDAIKMRPHFTLRKTREPRDAKRLARMALEAGYMRIVAAGGDGTTNEVINGLAAHLDRVTVGIIPLGTGNDLPRTLDIPPDPLEALELIDTGEPRPIDLIQVESEGNTAYCVNVAAGGFSGQVDEVLTPEMKATWGPLAYLFGAASVMPDLTHYRTTIACDDEPPQDVAALNVIVANARTAAGGRPVAPLANPEDGFMDIVIVHPGTALDLAGVAARLLAGNYLNSDIVSFRRAQKLFIESHPGMWFNIDGELLSKEPVTFTIRPRALRIIVGPNYQITPENP